MLLLCIVLAYLYLCGRFKTHNFMESKAKDYCIRAAIALLLMMFTGISAWAQDPASIGSIQYNSTLGAYEINSVQNLNDLAVYVNGRGTYSTSGDETTAHSCEGLTFKQTANITYTGTNNYTPIGLFVNDDGFQGTFDGQGNTISGIDCTGDGVTGKEESLGLFGQNQGTVRNVTLSGCRFASANNENYSDNYGNKYAIYVGIGSIAGINYRTGSITGCTVTGGTVSRIRTANADGLETPIGGIVGDNNGSITDCTYSGSVSGTYSGSNISTGGCVFYIGGIAGENNGSITGCGSDAAVSCSAPNVSDPSLFVGGIAGLNNGMHGDATVSDSFFSGTLSGTGKTGGSTYSIYIGAFVGRSINSSIVTNNYYYGDYAATIGYEGGNGTLANLVRVYQLTGNSITATAPQGSGTTFKGESYFKADATVTLAPQAGYAITAASYNDGSEDHEITPDNGVYLFTMPANDITVSATTIQLSGTCGARENDDVNWAVTDTDDDGTYDKLTISGTGAMANYSSSNQPWAAFKSDITTAVIEDGVTGIGMRDFYQFTALTSVSIASSVTIIDPLAFGGCTNLATISGATGVTYVGSSAFTGTAWLDALYNAQSDGLTYVGHVAYLFEGTDTSVNLDAGTTQIYDNCFLGSRITSIIIPASVTTIGDHAFAHSDNLQKIYMLRSGSDISDITQLGQEAFLHCYSLTVIVPADAYDYYDFLLSSCGSELTPLTPGYTITCEEGITVTTDGPLVAKDEVVTLSHNDRADYAFNGYSVKDSKNCDVAVYEEDGVYTFRMPDANVTVSATWEPANKITVTANKVDSNYWTTFYCGEAGYCIDDEDATAYTATVNNSTVTLHLLGKVIPMGTAAIIIGKDNSISMNRDDFSPAEYSVNNDLHGVDVRTLKSTLGTGTFYVMGKKGADFGFFEYTADYMPARKAYLLVDDSPALTKGLRMIIEDDADGIDSLTPTLSKGEGAVYNLSGRRINSQFSILNSQLPKGLYIINGKKVLK